MITTEVSEVYVFLELNEANRRAVGLTHKIEQDVKRIYHEAIKTIVRQIDISREAYEQSVKRVHEFDNRKALREHE